MRVFDCGRNSEVDCLICEKPILEASDHCEGEEAVFCEGSCQGRIHRIFVGVTCPAFEKLGEPDTQYLCSHCMLVSQSKEINNGVFRAPAARGGLPMLQLRCYIM